MRHSVVVVFVPGSVDPAGVIVHAAAHQLQIKEGFSDNEKKKKVQCANVEFQIFFRVQQIAIIWLFAIQHSINYMQKVKVDEGAHEWPTLKTSDFSRSEHLGTLTLCITLQKIVCFLKHQTQRERTQDWGTLLLKV